MRKSKSKRNLTFSAQSHSYTDEQRLDFVAKLLIVRDRFEQQTKGRYKIEVTDKSGEVRYRVNGGPWLLVTSVQWRTKTRKGRRYNPHGIFMAKRYE